MSPGFVNSMYSTTSSFSSETYSNISNNNVNNSNKHNKNKSTINSSSSNDNTNNNNRNASRSRPDRQRGASSFVESSNATLSTPRCDLVHDHFNDNSDKTNTNSNANNNNNKNTCNNDNNNNNNNNNIIGGVFNMNNTSYSQEPGMTRNEMENGSNETNGSNRSNSDMGGTPLASVDCNELEKSWRKVQSIMRGHKVSSDEIQHFIENGIEPAIIKDYMTTTEPLPERFALASIYVDPNKTMKRNQLHSLVCAVLKCDL